MIRAGSGASAAPSRAFRSAEARHAQAAARTTRASGQGTEGAGSWTVVGCESHASCGTLVGATDGAAAAQGRSSRRARCRDGSRMARRPAATGVRVVAVRASRRVGRARAGDGAAAVVVARAVFAEAETSGRARRTGRTCPTVVGAAAARAAGSGGPPAAAGRARRVGGGTAADSVATATGAGAVAAGAGGAATVAGARTGGAGAAAGGAGAACAGVCAGAWVAGSPTEGWGSGAAWAGGGSSRDGRKASGSR
jgi:hypothetical protein